MMQVGVRLSGLELSILIPDTDWKCEILTIDKWSYADDSANPQLDFPASPLLQYTFNRHGYFPFRIMEKSVLNFPWNAN